MPKVLQVAKVPKVFEVLKVFLVFQASEALKRFYHRLRSMTSRVKGAPSIIS